MVVQLDGNERITLAQFKDIFFSRHTEISHETYTAYETAFRFFIDSVGGATLLSRIEQKHFDKFKSDSRSRGLKKSSVNAYLKHLKTFFNKAYKWKYISEKIEIEQFKLGKRHPRVLSRAEKIKVYRYAKTHNYEMYRIIKFALWTDCRRAGIYNLRFQDIKGDIANVIEKGNRERSVPLLPPAIRAVGAGDIGFVFWHPKHIEYISKKFKAICRAVGIEDLHFHNLRHTAATDMLRSGIRIEYVQKILGHKSISVTQIYVKILQADLRREMQKMLSKRGQ